VIEELELAQQQFGDAGVFSLLVDLADGVAKTPD